MAEACASPERRESACAAPEVVWFSTAVATCEAGVEVPCDVPCEAGFEPPCEAGFDAPVPEPP